MKKQILAIAVVAGLGAVPLTAASANPAPNTPAPMVTAELGHVAAKEVTRRHRKTIGSMSGVVQAFCEGAGAAFGGIVGSVFGPVGTVIGAGIGAA